MFLSASVFFIVAVVLSYPNVPTDALQDKKRHFSSETLLFAFLGIQDWGKMEFVSPVVKAQFEINLKMQKDC